MDDPCDSVSPNRTCLCKENVTGLDCAECMDGYYGDPLNGIDCLKCPCPTEDNSHSSSCHTVETGGVVCDDCEDGHTGDRCEICDDGYYGNATVRLINNNY